MRFLTTDWKMVRDANKSDVPQASELMETLCKNYWLPVYSYLRRAGETHEDAQDLTQGFFLHALHNNIFAIADDKLGRLRNLLLASLKYFVYTAKARARAQKRGGNCEMLSLDFESVGAIYEMVIRRYSTKLVVLLSACYTN